MNECMFCMQMSPLNLDHKKILISESMIMIEKEQITDGIKGGKEPKFGLGPGNLPKNLPGQPGFV